MQKKKKIPIFHKRRKKKEERKTVEIRGKAGEIKSYLNSRPRVGGEKKGKGGGRLESRHFTSNMDEYKRSEREREREGDEEKRGDRNWLLTLIKLNCLRG